MKWGHYIWNSIPSIAIMQLGNSAWQ